jgi:hypothetical protein
MTWRPCEAELPLGVFRPCTRSSECRAGHVHLSSRHSVFTFGSTLHGRETSSNDFWPLFATKVHRKNEEEEMKQQQQKAF